MPAAIRCLSRAAAVILALTLVVVAGDAGAQSLPQDALASGDAASAAVPDSPEAVREMVSRLTDAEVRAVLLERLDAVARARASAQASGFADALRDAGTGLATSVGGAVERIGAIPAGVAEGVGRFLAPRGALGTLHLLAILGLALAVGLAAERALRRLSPAATPPDPAAEGSRLGASLRFLLLRLLHEGLGLAAFILAAWGVMAAAHPPERISYLILTFFLFGPVLLVRVAIAIGRFLLAPAQPAHRLLPLDDAAARFLHRGATTFAALVGLHGYVLSFLGGHGVDLAAMRLGFWLGLAVHGWLLFVVWRARDALRGMLLEGVETTAIERAVARAYPYAALALIAAVWALGEVFVAQGRWNLLDGRLPFSLAILLAAPIADRAIRALAGHAAPRPADDAPEPRRVLARRTRAGFVRMGRVAALGLLIVMFLDLWNVDLAEAATGPLPARVAASAVEAVAVVAIGWFVLEAVSLWITRRIVAEMPEAPAAGAESGGEGGGAGGSRLSTVLPLVLRTVQVAIVAVTLLGALSALGVSVTPLLAALGVIGLALGFGAQKLVADVVSGVFFLIDDAFRLGEYIEIEGAFGTVERISLRSLQMRHHLGKVHTIPFGEIPRLTNYSRDWVIMKLRFTVPFETDLLKVKKLFKKIGQDMIADPAFADDFLEPFKSQGVLEVDEVGIVIRGKFMAKPGRQWVLRKEIYQRVQTAFDENGIEFARREVRVRIDGEPGAPDDPALRDRAAASAAEAAFAGAEPLSASGATDPDGPGA